MKEKAESDDPDEDFSHLEEIKRDISKYPEAFVSPIIAIISTTIYAKSDSAILAGYFALSSLIFLVGFDKKFRSICFTGGTIAITHTVIFPLIYLYFLENIQHSFTFEEVIFQTEEALKYDQLVELEEEYIKALKLLSAIDGYEDKLSISYDSLLTKKMWEFDGVHLTYVLNRGDVIVGGGGGPIRPDERMILESSLDGERFQYVMEFRKIPRFSSLYEFLLLQCNSVEQLLFSVTDERLSMLENRNIWTYDNLINYSIKLFLLDSPMKPHVGVINQVVVFHFVFLIILSSRFIHLLNKN